MEYNIHFDPISNSLFVMALFSLSIALIGGFGFFVLRSWKPTDGEDSDCVGVGKIIYIIAYGIILIACTIATSCQTVGCKDTRLIQWEAAMLKTEVEVLKLKLELDSESESYEVPIPKAK